MSRQRTSMEQGLRKQAEADLKQLLIAHGLDAERTDPACGTNQARRRQRTRKRGLPPNVRRHALYRAGQFAESVKELDLAVKKTGRVGNGWEQMFLAMAHHRLGQDKEARDWLTKAVRQIEASEKENAYGFEQRVEWHYLRQEAETTLGWRSAAGNGW